MYSVMLEVHSDDNLNGVSVRAAFEFLPRQGDRLRIEDEVAPKVYQDFSRLSSTPLTGLPLFLETLFVEIPAHDEGAKREVISVIHVRVVPVTFPSYNWKKGGGGDE
ncbi:MAG: hypothetical protein AAFY20_18730 [Cyanobacteria bacterium J06639_14]